MAKRGRKPKERKGYFYEREEQAIVDYINETDIDKKNKIFNTILYPALTKMIESIIRRYKLFVPDEEFEQNFSDTISYLLTKINHFKPSVVTYEYYDEKRPEGSQPQIDGIDFVVMGKEELNELLKNAKEDDELPEYVSVRHQIIYNYQDPPKIVYQYYKKGVHHYKAYSYCGTVCKNYLMYKCSQYTKKRMRNTPYDDVFEEISNNSRYSTNEESNADIATKLVGDVANEIEAMVENSEENELSENEIIVGKALVNLLRNWENVLPYDGSNKLQKSSVLYFLREETMMTTKEIRDNMKSFKKLYYLLKKIELE